MTATMTTDMPHDEAEEREIDEIRVDISFQLDRMADVERSIVGVSTALTSAEMADVLMADR